MKKNVEMVTRNYYIGICENKGKIIPMIDAVNFVRKELDKNITLFKECTSLGYNVSDDNDIVEFYFSGSWYPAEIELSEYDALDITMQYDSEYFNINNYDLGI